MEEEHKVWIRGVNGRGGEVIKALEERGAEYKGFLECDTEELIYYINHDGYIDSINPDCELGRIIIDNYREIKLPELWQDGDILVDNDTPNRFAVKMNVWNDGNFKAYLFVNQKFIQARLIVTFCDKNYHKADSEEVRQFYELLHKYGEDWDAKKKQLVSWKWKSEKHKDYFFCLY